MGEAIIVYDNAVHDNRLKAAWGFACLLRLGKTILFDTGGDSSTLLYNIRQLQIVPREVDLVVLSHMHNDHVGGLSGFLRQNSDVIIYLPQSFPQSLKQEIKSYGARTIIEVQEATELCDNVYTTGELDTRIKEQSLMVRTENGLVIVAACAHPGIVNIVRRAKEIIADEVYLVLGGFHLLLRIEDVLRTSQVKDVLNSLRQLEVRKVAPCHCSGDKTQTLSKELYDMDYIHCGVGKIIPLSAR